MKKILLVCSIFLLAGCTSEPVELVEDDADEMLVYKDLELGYSFEYPSRYSVHSDGGQHEFDIGYETATTVMDENDKEIVTFAFYSEDFEFGIGEGCCYSYSDEPIDLSLANDKVITLLLEEFLGVFNVTPTYLGGEKAVEFVRVTQYVTTGLTMAMVVPFDNEPYANMTVSSGNYEHLDYDPDFVPMVDEYLQENPMDWTEDAQAILDSFEWL